MSHVVKWVPRVQFGDELFILCEESSTRIDTFHPVPNVSFIQVAGKLVAVLKRRWVDVPHLPVILVKVPVSMVVGHHVWW